jgi:uncharacterized protein YjbI with pentapeptide repeats
MNKLTIKLISASIGLLFSGLVMAGEFGDHCTTGLSKGALIPTKCSINEIYNGKTYCFGNEGARDSFLLDPDNTISKAAAFYAKNKEVDREKISQADALKQINSKTCDLQNKDMGYLVFNGLNLSHCNMQNVSFFGAELMGANLQGANLKNAYLNLARLENANLSKADLTNATIFQAIFDKTNFEGANLTNARMIGTLGNVNMANATIVKGRFGLDIGNQPMGAMRFDAIGGKFANTNFEGADINRSNFRFADFRGANLRNTDLFRADFSKADLTGADITGAKMGEAILDETIMTNVKGLESIKGYDEAKGKCLNCMLVAETPEPKKLSKVDLMTAENPAKRFCVMGARF